MSPWRSRDKNRHFPESEIGQHAYFETLFDGLNPSHHFPLYPGVQVQEWQTDLRDIVTSLLGLHHLTQVSLEPKVIGRREEEDYTIEHLLLYTERDTRMPAYFFRPQTPRGDGQAVLALHGEGVGVEDPQFPYIREFARRGYYVMAPVMRDFGERFDAEIESPQAQDILMLFGKNLLGLRVWESLRALEYLRNHEDVNPKHVGTCGMGLGAQLAMLVSAIDDQVACCGMCGFLTSYRDLLYTHHNIGNYAIPNILHYCDISDIAGLIAPRPLIVEAAEGDTTLSHREALRSFKQIERIYAAYSKPDRTQLVTFPGELRFHGVETYSWFSRWLTPQP